ncbi:ion transporter [bacterium SCSIO 12696]|nr:ion transporter [bacterium SCSIO 12696]
MPDTTLRQRLNTIIFGTDTPAGRRFDLVLIWLISISVVAVMLDTVTAVGERYGNELRTIEWCFTAVFTFEYLVRIYCSPKPLKYIFSFYGLVDLLSIVPTYLGLFFDGANYILVIRLLRVLRIFRVLKLLRYTSEANVLLRSVYQSRRKIFIFFSAVLVACTVFGTLMFLVEGPENGFTSIPKSIYWTIVTITTVGYGDIVPITAFGKIIASMAMLTGYSIIAIPTGILTAELATEIQRERIGRACRNCDKSGHDRDAVHCKFCGAKL